MAPWTVCPSCVNRWHKAVRDFQFEVVFLRTETEGEMSWVNNGFQHVSEERTAPRPARRGDDELIGGVMG